MSDGLDTAQDKVLQPLTGVGTDMSVQRPLRVSEKGAGEKSGQGEGGSFGFAGLSEAEQRRLTAENKTANFSLQDLGEPGERFETTQFLGTTQLSFPSTEARKIASLPGVEDVSEALTLTAANISGKVPKDGGQPSGAGPFGGGAGPGAQGAGGAPSEIDFDSNSVTGVAEDHPSLGAVTSAQVTGGRYFSSGQAREALLNISYARRRDSTWATGSS
jgi:putative ABC transport system permease protein